MRNLVAARNTFPELLEGKVGCSRVSPRVKETLCLHVLCTYHRTVSERVLSEVYFMAMDSNGLPMNYVIEMF